MNEKCQIIIFTTPSSIIGGGDVICHANDWLTSRQVDTMIDERTGWQIYTEPKIDSPKKPDNPYLNIKPLTSADWCFDKKNLLVLVDDNFKDIVGENVTREQCGKIAKLLTEPATQYKVGDSVICVYHRGPLPKRISYERVIDVDDATVVTQSQDGSVCSYDINGNHGDINGWHIDRVISPKEHIVTIGCLSGTVAEADYANYFILQHTPKKYSKIRLDALDARTRELVESLLKSQEEEGE